MRTHSSLRRFALTLATLLAGCSSGASGTGGASGSGGSSGGSSGGAVPSSACPGNARVLADGQDAATWIAVDDQSVYFATEKSATDGKISKVAKTGGTRTVLASDFTMAVWTPDIASKPFTIDATYLYYTSLNGIMKVPLAGGAPQKLSAATPVGLLAVPSENAIYLTGDDHSSRQCCEISRLATTGGEDTALSLDLTTGGALAVDAKNIYAFQADGLVSIPRAGGDFTTLAPGEYANGVGYTVGQAIAVDDTSVYWTYVGSGDFHDNLDGKVFKVAKTGGAPVVLADKQDAPWAIAIDDANVYYTAGKGVWRVSKSGGAPSPVGGGCWEPRGLAVDATSVYMADYRGQIVAIPK
jgi:hypothetical protein